MNTAHFNKHLIFNWPKLAQVLEKSKLISFEYYFDDSLIRFDETLINNNIFELEIQDNHFIDINELKKIIFPMDINILEEEVQKLKTGENSYIDREIRIKTFHKNYNWFNLVATKEENIDNKSVICGFIQSIQKQKETELELKREREKIEEIAKLRTSFIANMSHDIKTPLNSIVGFSELLTTSDNIEEKKSYIEIIKSNNKLLMDLINDVLDLSLIESEHIKFDYEHVDLEELFNEIKINHETKTKKGVALIFQNKGIKTQFSTDRKRLVQVLSNLIVNAIKNTNNGTVIFGYSYKNKQLRFFVKDSGVGISKDLAKNFFERIYKINNISQTSYMSLFICKIIVEKLGGELKIESELGSGTSFSFSLPVKDGIDKIGNVELKSNVSGISVKQKNDLSKKNTILVAEDVEHNFILVKMILKNNYELLHAKNGVEAVAMFKEYNPDLILMDIKMPEMDGLEATQKIREISTSVPIIALTAYALQTHRDEALAAGCNQIITKPVDSYVLKSNISKYLK